MANTEELIKAVAVTAELLNTELTDAAAKVMVDDLSAYPPDQVFGALKRCRREVKGRLTIAEIISRLDDGRPGPEEAWAMIPKSEYESGVWTEEMRNAYGIVNGLIESGDEIGARMAFKEAYQAQVANARAAQREPKWEVTLGYGELDPSVAKQRRQGAITQAVESGRLSHDTAESIMPGYSDRPQIDAPRLTNDNATPASEAMQHIEAMKQLYGPSPQEQEEQ